MKNVKERNPKEEHATGDAAHKKNEQEKNEHSTSQENEFDVSTEDRNENEVQGATGNQPLRNAENENERFNQQLKQAEKK
ncbi:MAG: hypothetical protein IPO83_10995 [Chitinophagaceae bacterium]|nr:hypothetical protein [Chitinophagaceae bacterium]